MPRRLCHYCHQPMKRGRTQRPRSMTWDHLTPRSRGGTNDPSNKVRACFRCNGDKGDMTEDEYWAELARRRAVRAESAKRNQQPAQGENQ